MTKHRDLEYGDPLPVAYVDPIQEFISTYASPNFIATLQSPTTIQVVAGTDNDQVAVAINGRWRYNVATVQAAHPGGPAGSYDVYVTGSDNSYAGSPEVDSTVYAFGLQIKATGQVPSTVLKRKVGTVTWDGSQITKIRLTVGAQSTDATDFVQTTPSGAQTVIPSANVVPLIIGTSAGQTADRFRITDSSGTTVFSIAPSGAFTAEAASFMDAVLTLRNGAYLAAIGATSTTTTEDKRVTGDSQARLLVDASGRHSWGSGAGAQDVTLYRGAADTLKTDDALQVGGGVLSLGSLTTPFAFGGYVTSGNVFAASFLLSSDANAAFRVFGSGRIEWGPGGASATDVSLNRSGAGALTLTGALTVSGALASGAHTATTGAFSGVVTLPAGAVGAPALAVGEATTGLYRVSAGVLGIATGGVQRVQIDAAGGIQLPGISSTHPLLLGGDAPLYRQAAAVLGVDAQVAIFPNGAPTTNAQGLKFGADVVLYRAAADILQTDDRLVVLGSGGFGLTISAAQASAAIWSQQAGSVPVLANVLSGTDTQYAFAVTGNGTIWWGAGGGSAADVSLYRAGIAVLETQGSLQINGALAGAYRVFRTVVPSGVGGGFEGLVSGDSSVRIAMYVDSANRGSIIFTNGAGGGSQQIYFQDATWGITATALQVTGALRVDGTTISMTGDSGALPTSFAVLPGLAWTQSVTGNFKITISIGTFFNGASGTIQAFYKLHDQTAGVDKQDLAGMTPLITATMNAGFEAAASVTFYANLVAGHTYAMYGQRGGSTGGQVVARAGRTFIQVEHVGLTNQF